MSRCAAVTGWGHYAPERVLTNRDLEAMLDTNADWIQSRTGIAERRLARAGESTSTLCSLAARQALTRAGLAASDLDLVICATTTPDNLLPATGCLVQKRIEAVNAGAFDVNCACTGFVTALMVGSQFIQAGTYERVLVVSGETLSRFLNWKDRQTCVLFGDGAGAVVLEATDQECGIQGVVLGCQGDVGRLLAIPAGGSAHPASADTVADAHHSIHMKGNELFKCAVRSMGQAARLALAKANVELSEIRKVIPHQANLRIIRATQEALGLPADKMFINVDRYGNTGAASVAIALSEFLTDEPPQAGDNLLLVAFGGGLTWASTVLRWADVEAVRRQSPARIVSQAA